MSIVFQKSYAYLLITHGNSWYVTFFTGGPVELDICVKLTDDEIKLVKNDQKALEQLIARFNADHSLFAGRRIIPSITS